MDHVVDWTFWKRNQYGTCFSEMDIDVIFLNFI